MLDIFLENEKLLLLVGIEAQQYIEKKIKIIFNQND